MKPWMRMMVLGAALGAVAGLAGCESEDEGDDTAGTVVVTNVVVVGGQTNLVVVVGEANDAAEDGQADEASSTNTIPDLNPVIPILDPVVILKPDLKITDLAPGAAPFFGWQVKVTVKNAGKLNSNGFAIKLYRDGVQRDMLNVPGLLSGAQATLTFPNYTFGCPENAPDTTRRAVADSGNQIAESDEANNAYQENWGCPPP